MAPGIAASSAAERIEAWIAAECQKVEARLIAAARREHGKLSQGAIYGLKKAAMLSAIDRFEIKRIDDPKFAARFMDS